MHRKYAADGLVAISVNLDDPNKKEDKDKAIKFLQEKKATLTNLMLNEKPEVWQDKLKIEGLPAVFVFNREGRREKKFGGSAEDTFEYKDVEKLVMELLKKK